MSRIGKRPIDIPDKVQVNVDGQSLTVKGPKGELDRTLPKGVVVSLADKSISLTPVDGESQEHRSLWGMARTLVANMVEGVTNGFSKKLEFSGVGYKAAVKGETLQLSLGYSHPINYKYPKGIEVKVQKNIIELSCCSKELLGLTAAKIRSFRPPEPYKGKGIKYIDERIIRKAGKAGAKK
ncbi:MAG: 50S ribosomal protein L6 [Bacteriovoracales bacterium]|nr:50S ribosomal protein L6 [Bacteriovoracales bacterium]